MSIACREVEMENQVFTPQGNIFLEGPVSSDCMERLNLHEGLKNFRAPQKQKEALMQITNLPDGMVYIARLGEEVVGYVTFHHPDKFSRWSQHPRILELGAIEITPAWRQYKLGVKLLQLAFSNPLMEEYIFITIEFCWHWDLRNTCLDVWQYQKLLTKLFGSVGLKRVPTDDPDILEHIANVLMVRIGEKVSEQDILLFEQLQFMDQGIVFPNR